MLLTNYPYITLSHSHLITFFFFFQIVKSCSLNPSLQSIYTSLSKFLFYFSIRTYFSILHNYSNKTPTSYHLSYLPFYLIIIFIIFFNTTFVLSLSLSLTRACIQHQPSLIKFLFSFLSTLSTLSPLKSLSPLGLGLGLGLGLWVFH